MKKVILFAFSLCFTILLNAQVPKTANTTSGSLTSKIDTTQRTAPNFKNNPGKGQNQNTPTDLTSPNMDVLRSGRNFELNRVELEKQTMAEMETYRNEILNRLIMEEYSRLINDKTPNLPDNNRDGISKLAKYKTLRELLQEQISRRSKPILPNSGSSNASLNTPKEHDNLIKQLDLKIGEEEQRAEMDTRHRMEMEMRMEQERQKQQQKK